MNRKDLIIGQRYILRRPSRPVAVYEGVFEGKLELADGAVYYGSQEFLRFRIPGAVTPYAGDDPSHSTIVATPDQIVFLSTGADRRRLLPQPHRHGGRHPHHPQPLVMAYMIQLDHLALLPVKR
jgi:hypothetical protein